MRIRGIATVLTGAARNLYYGNGAEWAASLAYYSLLSVFPAALLGVSVATQFVDETWAIDQIVGGVERLLPAVSDAVARDVKQAISQRGQVGFLALLMLTWTGSRVFSTLTHAIDLALGRAERSESLLRSIAREVVLLGVTGGVLIMGTLAGVLLHLVAKATPFGAWIAVPLATALARTLLFGTAMLLIFSFVPAPRPPLRPAVFGALASTSILVVAMPLFSTYVSRLGRYNMIYGPVAIIIVVLVWFWVAAFVVLYGAHVTSLLERQGLAGNTAPPPRPPSDSEHMP